MAMGDSGAKPFSQACENNKAPILKILKEHLNQASSVLEIGSGTGQHGVYFSAQMPHLFWQTSDRRASHAGINDWIEASQLGNIGAPVHLDVVDYSWGETKYDAIFAANTLHIMPWKSAEYFLRKLPGALHKGGYFIAYGPFNYRGEYTSASNAQFDVWLKSQDAQSAIRDFEALDQVATESGMKLLRDHEMPANNRLLVWQKV